MNKVTVIAPPSINSAYFNVGRRRAKAKCYTDWEKLVYPTIKAEMEPVDYPVFIEYVYTLGTSFRGDLSNRLKLMEDALVKCGILVDDNWRYVSGHSVQYDRWQARHSALTVTIHKCERVALTKQKQETETHGILTTNSETQDVL